MACGVVGPEAEPPPHSVAGPWCVQVADEPALLAVSELAWTVCWPLEAAEAVLALLLDTVSRRLTQQAAAEAAAR